MNKELREKVKRIVDYGIEFNKKSLVYEIDDECADELITLILDEKWIKVSDRLPDENDDILIYDADDNIEVAQYEHSGRAYSFFVGASVMFTNWMPLPKPPIDNLRGNDDTHNN